VFNNLRLMRVLLGHMDVLILLGEAAPEFAAAHTTVDKWDIIKPVGDKLVPAIDDILTQLKSSGNMQMMATAEELEATVLNQVKAAYVDYAVKNATRGMVLAANADDEAKKKHAESKLKVEEQTREQATAEAHKRFDGKWLNAALELFKTVAPILLPALLHLPTA
jgi:hypothetical protein